MHEAAPATVSCLASRIACSVSLPAPSRAERAKIMAGSHDRTRTLDMSSASRGRNIDFQLRALRAG
eukprot:851295-Prymnesium_polylepis.1